MEMKGETTFAMKVYMPRAKRTSWACRGSVGRPKTSANFCTAACNAAGAWMGFGSSIVAVEVECARRVQFGRQLAEAEE